MDRHRRQRHCKTKASQLLFVAVSSLFVTVYVDFTNAGLESTIPSQLGLASGLRFLYLSQNPHLTGTIPTELGWLTHLGKFIIAAATNVSLV